MAWKTTYDQEYVCDLEFSIHVAIVLVFLNYQLAIHEHEDHGLSTCIFSRIRKNIGLGRFDVCIFIHVYVT
jgi:hypothetical protein